MKKNILITVIIILAAFFIYNYYKKESIPEPVKPVTRIKPPEDIRVETDSIIDKINLNFKNSDKYDNIASEIKNITSDSYIYDKLVLNLKIKTENYPYLISGFDSQFNFENISVKKNVYEDKQNFILLYKNLQIADITVHFDRIDIAIIIDDVGYNLKILKDFSGIGKKLNFSILPGLAYTKRSAELLKETEHTIMLHLPMEPLNPLLKVPDAIKTDMNYKDIEYMFEKSYKAVPYITGINNHMGSKATQDPRVMNLVLDIVKEKGLFFVDSLTSPKSIAYSVAKKKDIPTGINECFIDNIDEVDYILKRLKHLKHISIRKDYPEIAIGHNKKNTFLALKQFIDDKNNSNIRFVSLKHYFNMD